MQEFRVHQTVSQRSVVGHKHEAGGIFVEPADREKSFLTFHKILYGRFPFLQAACHNAVGLVQNYVTQLLRRFDHFGVVLDEVPVRVDFRAQDLYGLAVDSDLPGEDVLFGPAARTDPSFGKIFLQTHQHVCSFKKAMPRSMSGRDDTLYTSVKGSSQWP